jgi:hypothetical protein
MDEIGTSYLKLALDLDRHFEGFVDAYFGPPELKAQAQAGEPRPLEALADDAYQIQASIRDSAYDPQRKDFLTRQMRAMVAVIDNLCGEQLDFVAEVEHYFDVVPEMVDEAVFEAAHTEIDNLLPGSEPLGERLVAWKKQLELEPSRILPVLELARQETRRRTVALFELPAGEEFSLQLVSDQPWSGYNWYLGNYRSRIDINTDLPVRADMVVPLMAHEGYAGHHTEHAIKEAVLYKDGGRTEHGVQLLLAPECVLSEGIANSARKVIFDRADLVAFLHEELYPLAGLSHVDVEQQIRLTEAARELRGVDGNAALLLHRDGQAADEVQKYIEHYSLRTPKEAAQTMKFFQNPLFRSYIFNYAIGETLLAPLVEGPEAVTNFRRLLQEPLTPSQVRQWLAQLDRG